MKIHEMSISKGITLNIGNYESLRVDVMMSARQDTGESANATFTKLREEVDAKLNDLLEQAKGEGLMNKNEQQPKRVRRT